MARKRKSTRRRSSSRRAGGFVDREALKTGATAALAIAGLNKILPRIIPPDMAANRWSVPLASIGIGLLAGYALRRTSPALAKGAAIGGVTAGTLSLITQFVPGMSGMGALPPGEYQPRLGAGFPNEYQPALGAAAGQPDNPYI
jgi:hypothetical protein